MRCDFAQRRASKDIVQSLTTGSTNYYHLAVLVYALQREKGRSPPLRLVLWLCMQRRTVGVRSDAGRCDSAPQVNVLVI
jgi:hypothetical protein